MQLRTHIKNSFSFLIICSFSSLLSMNELFSKKTAEDLFWSIPEYLRVGYIDYLEKEFKGLSKKEQQEIKLMIEIENMNYRAINPNFLIAVHPKIYFTVKENFFSPLQKIALKAAKDNSFFLNA